MNWKSHTIIAFFLSLAVFYFVFSIRDADQLPQLLVFSIFSALSALVPDLDHDMSKGKKLLDVVAILIALVIAAYFYFSDSYPGFSGSIFVFFAIMGAYFLLFKLFKPKHRGLTHTLVAGLVFCVLVYLLAGLNFAVAALLGYFSHLVLDRVIKV